MQPFQVLKARVLASERVLLQAMRFDLGVNMPFRPLIKFANALTSTLCGHKRGCMCVAGIGGHVLTARSLAAACNAIWQSRGSPSAQMRSCKLPGITSVIGNRPAMVLHAHCNVVG